MTMPTEVVTDSDVLRDYGTYCSQTGTEVAECAKDLANGGRIRSDAWYGAGMTKLLTLQDNLDALKTSYESCLAATVGRLDRIASVLQLTDTTLHSVADNYDASDRLSSNRIRRAK